MKIAIDGPSGVGKSTLAKAIADEYNLLYIDTGAMYRMVALYFLRNGLDHSNESVVEKNLSDIEISLSLEKQIRFLLNGDDVTDFLRTSEIAEIASVLAKLKCVRKKLESIQKDIANKNEVVMDGRDIASNIIPDADLKFYLEAKPSVRAQRRLEELNLGQERYDEIYNKILLRDENDLKREFSPLKKVPDAMVIDTSFMSFEQVKQKVFGIIDGFRAGE